MESWRGGGGHTYFLWTNDQFIQPKIINHQDVQINFGSYGLEIYPQFRLNIGAKKKLIKLMSEVKIKFDQVSKRNVFAHFISIYYTLQSQIHGRWSMVNIRQRIIQNELKLSQKSVVKFIFSKSKEVK